MNAGQTFDPFALKAEFPGLADPELHYLDSAATSQMPGAVIEALRRFEVEARANVHEGMHRRARVATEAYWEARVRTARFLNASSEREVVFTYGATSSINLLAHSFGELLKPGEEILLSVLEHHSNLVPWQQLARRRGVVLRFLPVTPEGRLDLAALETELTARCRFVAITHCSNVTGALTDVPRVVAAARTVGAKVMLDGAQRAPHGPLDVQQLDADFYVFSGHKAYGPTGIGALWGRYELLNALPPFMTGGQMIDTVTATHASFRPAPRRFEAGTPPIGAAIGMGAALDWAKKLDWSAIRDHETGLTLRLIHGLASIAGVRMLGPLDARDRRGVVTFTVDSIPVAEVCRRLDNRGVAVRGGHHCAQPLMHAFGLTEAVRVSLAPYSTGPDIDVLLHTVASMVHNGAKQVR